MDVPTVSDFDVFLGFVTVGGGRTLDLGHDVHARFDLSKDHVFAVEMRGRHSGDEELRAIRVFPGIGHGEQAGLGVLVLEALIRKLGTIDRFTTTAVTSGKVTALEHKPWNDAMKDGSLVMEGLALSAHALLACAESAEVFRGSLEIGIVVQLHDDATLRFASNRDIKEHLDHLGRLVCMRCVYVVCVCVCVCVMTV